MGIRVFPMSCRSAASPSAAVAVIVEPELLAYQEAERGHVDRMAVGQVLVQLDRQNLSERGAAPGDFLNEQLDDVPDGDDVHALAAGDVVERTLGECQRLGVVRIHRTDRRVRPHGRVPAGVEGNQAAEADVPDAASRELDVDGSGCRRRVSELPEELRERMELLLRDARTDVDAVDSELGELVEDMSLGFALAPERDAVEVRRAVDHIEFQGRRILEMLLDGAVDLTELLLDRRMAGGIHAGQATEADEAFEQRQWIRRRQLGRCTAGWHRSSYC